LLISPCAITVRNELTFSKQILTSKGVVARSTSKGVVTRSI